MLFYIVVGDIQGLSVKVKERDLSFPGKEKSEQLRETRSICGSTTRGEQ